MPNTFERLLEERDRYNVLMYQVLNGTHHLKKKGERIRHPLSEKQKAKNKFLFKYYEHHYNKLSNEIDRITGITNTIE